MGEIRGKMVLINRLGNHQSKIAYGLEVAADWPDNASEWVTTSLKKEQMYVQDQYEISKFTFEKKYQAFSTIRRWDGEANRLVLNFASHAWCKCSSVKTIANKFNQLIDNCQTHNALQHSVTIMDFPPQSLVDRIIGLTFND